MNEIIGSNKHARSNILIYIENGFAKVSKNLARYRSENNFV